MIETRGLLRGYDPRRQFRMLRSQYLSWFLILTYTVLPGVSSILFRFLECQNVDPDGVVLGSQRYMTADYSVSCDSDRRYFGLVWSIIMIFVYPVGIPAMYFTLLYQVGENCLLIVHFYCMQIIIWPHLLCDSPESRF